jgi:hypothetical protein
MSAATRARRAAPKVELSAELVDRLLYLASRAPSPHNAQGWRIDVDGPRFRVRLDPDRQVMHALDPHGREGDLAGGAAVANLRAGAAALGFTPTVAWRPELGVLADVTLAPGAAAADAVARHAALPARA